MKVLLGVLVATWQAATAQFEIPPELLLASLGTFPPCHMCSNMSDEPIDLDGIEFDNPYIETTCKSVFFAGEQGYIPPEMCVIVRDFQSLPFFNP